MLFHNIKYLILFAVVLPAGFGRAAEHTTQTKKPVFSAYVYPGSNGKLVYKSYNEQGDRIPDFSNCGYGGGGIQLPEVPVKITLAPDPAIDDNTDRIQKAIDQVAEMPCDTQGFRGAVLLTAGQYPIKGSLKISVGGIVLKGQDNKTVLAAAGTLKRSLIQIGGRGEIREAEGTRQNIVDRYVPVGANTFQVENGSKWKAGDPVIVGRVGNQDWIHEIGMDRIQLRPDNPSSTKQWLPFSIEFDRLVLSVKGSTITLDAPITCSIDARWGGGYIYRYEDPRIERVGIENLEAVSEFDKTKKEKNANVFYFSDENHATYLVSFRNVKNAWARDLSTQYFCHGVASIGSGSKWITVQDCKSSQAVSKLEGGRRYPFVVYGQLCLIQRCTSRDARHAFAFGARTPGPNVFLGCRSENDYNSSEPHHRWSTGGLYDNVFANLAIQDRQWMGTGQGWAGANYVVWNSDGRLVCQKPPTAQNLAIGFTGRKNKGSFDRPDGLWELYGQNVTPQSLYLKQVEDRLGFTGR